MTSDYNRAEESAANHLTLLKLKKIALRQQYATKRRNLSKEEAGQKNTQICRLSEAFLNNVAFKVLHTFLPQRNKNEVDTRPIIASVASSLAEAVIVVPYVIPGTREMLHYQLNPETMLIENSWGIPEPDPLTSVPIEVQLIDIVLIPLLSFDKRGYRVGYGGGYYDRFLAKCRADVVKIGVCFFDPVDLIEDVDEFDIPLDYCVTPDMVWSW